MSGRLNWRDRSSEMPSARSSWNQNGRSSRDPEVRSTVHQSTQSAGDQRGRATRDQNIRHPQSSIDQHAASSRPTNTPEIEISFFYNSRQKAANGTVIILRRSECPPHADATFSPSGLHRHRPIIPNSEELVPLYKLFKSFLVLLNNYMSAFKVTHPSYGLIHLVKSTLEDEDRSDETGVGLIVKNSTFDKCVRDAYEAGSQATRSIDEFVESMRTELQTEVPLGMRILNEDHIKEAGVAETELLNVGVVTAIVTFQEFVYEFLSAAFDHAYASVGSVESFERIWPGGDQHIDDNSALTFLNVFKLWLSDPINITEELKNYFDSCRHEPNNSNNSNDQEGLYEYTVDEMYELMKNNPRKFHGKIKEILTEYKARCLEKLLTNPSLELIGEVVGLLLKQNSERGRTSAHIFTDIFTEIVQKNEEYFGMLMWVRFNSSGYNNYPLKFCLRNENIMMTIGSPETDATDWCVLFDVDEEQYCCPLSKENRRAIRMSYQDFDGWWMWIDENTRYVVKPGDVETVNHLIRLFVGIKCLLLQGGRTHTVDHLANIPSRLNIVTVKETINQAEDEDDPKYNRLLTPDEAKTAAEVCERHLLHIWRKVLENGHNFKMDYYLYFTIVKFFIYVAQHVGRTVACCLWKVQTSYGVQFGMDTRDLDNISRAFN